MACEPLRENIEAYALGALDSSEVEAIEAHLADCSNCRDIFRAYRIAVEHLALSVPMYRAPTRLREVVLGSVGAFRPRITPGALLKGSRWWAAAAAVFLAFAIGGLTWAIILSSQVSELKKDNASLADLTELDEEQRDALLLLRSELSSTKSQQQRLATTLQEQATLIVLALDPDLIPTELQGTTLASEAGCRYVWSTKQSLGALTCQNLPALTSTLTYQFWITKGDKTVNAGVFGPFTDGSAHLLVKLPEELPGPVSNMFVTLEGTTNVVSRPSTELVLTRSPAQQAAR